MKDLYINPITSIAIMFSTVAVVLTTGAIAAVFSTNYESSCTPNEAGKSICTQTVKFQGWAGIPVQPIAGAIGVGVGAYAAVKSGKLPFVAAEEPSNDNLPS